MIKAELRDVDGVTLTREWVDTNQPPVVGDTVTIYEGYGLAVQGKNYDRFEVIEVSWVFDGQFAPPVQVLVLVVQPEREVGPS